MKKSWLLVLLCLLMACNADEVVTPVAGTETAVTPTHTPMTENETTPQSTDSLRPTPIPATVTINPSFFTLNLCLAGELPTSLYRLQAGDLAQTDLFQLIYEPLFELADYEVEPRGIVDARVTFETVLVAEGELVVDVQGNVTPLTPNLVLYDLAGSPFTYAGGAVELPQMVVVSRFAPMFWSDGVPVTAFDSEFAYQLSVHPDTPNDKTPMERTDSYTALDAETVRWVGLPGWRDPLYWQNIWQPLPRHRWGQYAPADLLTLPEVIQTPLGNGPYFVKQHTPESLQLEYNPYYYRLVTDNVPRIPFIEVRFISDINQRAAQLLSGQCDFILANEDAMSLLPFALEMTSNELGKALPRPSSMIEQLVFGNESWFDDVQVRQAVAHCLDRANIAETGTQGRFRPMEGYVHSEHPLADGVVMPEYAPNAGRAILDGLGWVDSDGDGVREDEAQRPFALTLLTTTSAQTAVVPQIGNNLRACGIAITHVEVDNLPDSYDLALVSQPTGFVPPCQDYIGALGLGDDFAQACLRGNGAMWGSPEFEASHREALRLWGETITAVSLYAVPELAVSSLAVLETEYNISEPSPLWNVAEWELLAR